MANCVFRPSTVTRGASTYASAGVSKDVGNESVERIIPYIFADTSRGICRGPPRYRTWSENTIGHVLRIRPLVSSTRGYGAEIEDLAGKVNSGTPSYVGAPVIVGAIDGVGTKLMIVQGMEKHSTVGIDQVAMNVNDLVVQGTELIIFLDYYGCRDWERRLLVHRGVGAPPICRCIGGVPSVVKWPGIYQRGEYEVCRRCWYNVCTVPTAREDETIEASLFVGRWRPLRRMIAREEDTGGEKAYKIGKLNSDKWACVLKGIDVWD